MAITKNKRNEMEKLIYVVFDKLDPTNINTKKYKDLFKSMSDIQFDIFFKELFKNEDEYLVWDIVDYERDAKIEQIEEAAKVLNVPLFEKVVMPFINNDLDNPVVTKYEVPVGYAHLKRMQQLLTKKNTQSTEISTRSAMTGQVVGKDKNARESDQENFSLLSVGAIDALRELNGPRADDMVMKNELYSAISQKGYVSLNELTNNTENKTTLNLIDVYFIAMGIKTDLVTKGLLVKKSLKR